MAAPDVPDSDRLELAERLARSLSEALSSGDKETSSKNAALLAELSLPVSVNIRGEAYSDNQIRLKVGIEDAIQELAAPITLTVTADMTISELKEKVNKDFGFHPSLQAWVIGKRLAHDDESLYSHGVRKDGDQVYLYLRSAKKANLSREQQKQYEEIQRLDGIIEIMEADSLQPRGTGGTLGAQNEARNLLPKLAPSLKPQPKPRPPPKPQVGWPCPICTFVNKPTRPGCEMCGEPTPADYKIPRDYQADAEEENRLKTEEFACLQYQQALEDERLRNFHILKETEEHNLIPNQEEVECPICFTVIGPGDGATLRECLHNFCKDCLKGTITNSMDAEVSCPYGNDDYVCESKLQDREIQALLSPEEYAKILELRLSIAETRSENSYHCKTPDCAGWCIFEDEVNEFECQLCRETNCLLCKAIHKDMNCQQYQDDLRIRAENDVAARQTTEMLNTMLQTGEAMNCPRCKIIVQKKDGCDWMCCVMCKTEICWVTRQARWGPNGHGDTSGGCRCRVNGALCHPQCQNCH
ncbi:ranBP-type and C3HC4-type zinc finger-containing protein 1 [Brienomyrus brachyistius]|uniref:ranBP-type and C3HC4-type zinc finger-containing protein 1 n=1 Tax=Brienomyrus brachyistius TaxID=42636 RepID=UPI0020B3ECFA|nr:ranBP-type and C3HC4-type zinc finger-containing protein 1 [Brienomyrus brachyistius]XP_048877949.1 ranBP-type and C3HC4-type zinc finger-containing protein 1 [Brienomyrus brachyistius]